MADLAVTVLLVLVGTLTMGVVTIQVQRGRIANTPHFRVRYMQGVMLWLVLMLLLAASSGRWWNAVLDAGGIGLMAWMTRKV